MGFVKLVTVFFSLVIIMRNRFLLSVCLLVSSQLVMAGATLDEVKKRGSLKCGVSSGLLGFSAQDAAGKWQGFDVDVCRAVAAAVLGDADKVSYVPLQAGQRLSALTDKKIDLLAHNTTWTMDRDLTMGLDFIAVNFYDGQGFMLPRDSGVYSTLELSDKKICVQRGTTSEKNVEQYFAVNRMTYSLVKFDKREEMVAAYDSGVCDVLTSDESQLYSTRMSLSKRKDSRVLPEAISKEPLSPVVREGDSNWSDIVRWTLFSMINAEEIGVTAANVVRLRRDASSDSIRRFLDIDGVTGKALGLESPWVYRVISQVGNYGESFERNLGKQSSLGIQRGMNALWIDVGFIYAPPSR